MSLLPVLLLAAAGTLDYGGRSEMRLRGGMDAPVFDVEATPAARLSLRSRGWDGTLGYAPRFTLRQTDLRASFEVFQAGALTLTWAAPRTAAILRAAGTYGTESFASLALRSPEPDSSPQLDRLPETIRVEYASLAAGATVTHAASRRWRLRGTVEYVLSGGVDEPSRARVPFQLGPRGSLGAEYSLTRKDRLVSAVDASQVAFSSGSQVVLLSATEAWRRALSSRAESTLRAGIAGAFVQTDEAAAQSLQVYPLAEAAMAYRLPADRLELRASVWIAPVVDRLSGQVDGRLQAAVSGEWNPSPSLAVRGRIGAAQSVLSTGDRAISLGLADVAMSVKVTERVRVDVGTRGALQQPQGASQWVFFVAASFAAQPVRF